MKLAICLFAVGVLIGMNLVARLTGSPTLEPVSEPQAVLPVPVPDSSGEASTTAGIGSVAEPSLMQTDSRIDELIGQSSGTRALAIAVTHASTQDYAPNEIQSALRALVEADQRAFQLALVTEWATVDGTAALLYASGLEPSLRRRAVERVATASARKEPLLALQAGSLLRTRDAYFYHRNVFVEWARNDLDGLYIYLDGVELTMELTETIPVWEMVRAPERLLALSERAPGYHQQIFADLAREALDE